MCAMHNPCVAARGGVWFRSPPFRVTLARLAGRDARVAPVAARPQAKLWPTWPLSLCPLHARLFVLWFGRCSAVDRCLAGTSRLPFKTDASDPRAHVPVAHS